MLLDTLSTDSCEPKLNPLSRQLGLHKSTIHRLLTALENHRLVSKSPIDGSYRLGIRLFELGAKAVESLNVVLVAHPLLKLLCEESNETTHLGILEGGEILHIDKVEPSRTVRIPTAIGHKYPAHVGAAGKALISALSEKELDDLLRKRGLPRFTNKTITDPQAFKHELETIRRRGYAVSHEEYEEGLSAVGTVIRGHSGNVVAAISIVGPTFRLSAHTTIKLAGQLMKAAADISASLGYPKSGSARDRWLPESPIIKLHLAAKKRDRSILKNEEMTDTN